MAYLDHAGAGKASDSQLKAIANDLLHLNLSNPHSKHQSAKFTSAVVDDIRTRILQHFNVSLKTHAVIFTSGATEALKLVAESFDFGNCSKECICKTNITSDDNGIFVYLTDSHTSVVGMRDVVRRRCNAVCVVDNIDDIQNLKPNINANEIANDTYNLFTITAMSNFCGRKYPMDVIDKIHQWKSGHSFVCVDAAAWVSSSPFDLSKYAADFLTFSFYKIFGYPTGLGALIVRRDSAERLKKNYYGGGTVKLLIPNEFSVFYKDDLSQRFEDGTINYWNIAALKHGFMDLNNYGGIEGIQQKTYDLYSKFRSLLNQKYSNGNSVAVVYENKPNASSAEQGPIVTFNLLDENGAFVGYSEVDKMCGLYGIELRTGCFCNQGACQRYLNISQTEQMSSFQKGKECGDKMDLFDDGRPLGAVRVSFGRQSTVQDIELFERMLQKCYLSRQVTVDATVSASSTLPTLTGISVFPVKSCTAFQPKRWELCETGLKYDRLWMIISASGVYVSLKTVPKLYLIQPEITDGCLVLKAKSEALPPISVMLDADEGEVIKDRRVCSDRVDTVDCGDEVGEWISAVIDVDGCRLHRKIADQNSRICSLQGSSKPPIGLSNEAPYLLINRNSVAMLAPIAGLTTEQAINRFRANFVIDGIDAFAEDNIIRVQIGNVRFQVIGKCTRCQIIGIDSETAQKDPGIMLALKNYRTNSKLTFGIYLQHEKGSEGQSIEVGMPVQICWQ